MNPMDPNRAQLQLEIIEFEIVLKKYIFNNYNEVSKKIIKKVLKIKNILTRVKAIRHEVVYIICRVFF